ncbi:22807_t:CDS:2 [Cetraspora pellucida]|uniref:22807_t:CDS:1 n=1 Tax=Cetraspora pellucida TaxID=1433469 RepID=A0A9N8WJE4_9GLOM|nr:22807_t:CDS:2 [Cetraspora pellucida]
MFTLFPESADIESATDLFIDTEQSFLKENVNSKFVTEIYSEDSENEDQSDILKLSVKLTFINFSEFKA